MYKIVAFMQQYTRRVKYFVYLLECADGTFYIGSTNDVEKRVHEHNHTKNGAHYTKIRRPVTLRYTEECATLSEARKRENELKQLTRKQKEQLLSSSPSKI